MNVEGLAIGMHGRAVTILIVAMVVLWFLAKALQAIHRRRRYEMEHWPAPTRRSLRPHADPAHAETNSQWTVRGRPGCYEVTNHLTGEMREYDSIDRCPPEVRAQLERIGRQVNVPTLGEVTQSTTVEYRVTDESGTERVYHSLDDVPADIRSFLDELVERPPKGPEPSELQRRRARRARYMR